MSNISIEASLVDGSLMPYVTQGESCAAAVGVVTGDDLRPPARHLMVQVLTASGKTVKVIIPNSTTDGAVIRIDGEII